MLAQLFLLSAGLLVAMAKAGPLASSTTSKAAITTKIVTESTVVAPSTITTTSAPSPSASRTTSASETPTAHIAMVDSSNAVVTGAAAVNSINDNDGIGGGRNVRRSYSGDGSTRQGWPSKSQWVSFNDMFNNNVPAMRRSCSQYGVPNNSQNEINAIRAGIESVAASSKVDHRLILAVVMQESTGCVRVPTTKAPNYNIYNPGLMQDFDGYYTCNCRQNDQYNQRCGVVSPCPSNTITGMIREGAVGTNSGDGLASLINAAQNKGASGAQVFYVAANWYNQGPNVPFGSPLSGYGVDIANRLTGWLGN